VPNVDIEAALVPWLNTRSSTRCVTELPANLAAVLPLIQVGRIGGADGVVTIDEATVDVTCFGATRTTARALAYRVQSILRTNLPGAAVTGGIVLRVNTLSGPTYLPFADETLRRFGATYQIVTQATA
jgi:hypothetical protein